MERSLLVPESGWTGAAMIRIFQRVPPCGQQAGIPTTIRSGLYADTRTGQREFLLWAIQTDPLPADRHWVSLKSRPTQR